MSKSPGSAVGKKPVLEFQVVLRHHDEAVFVIAPYLLRGHKWVERFYRQRPAGPGWRHASRGRVASRRSTDSLPARNCWMSAVVRSETASN